MALPNWLIAHLTATGRHNPDGIARAARYHRCEHCSKPVLRGLNADTAAMAVICDPQEIDANGELLALALNLRTYTLTRSMSSNGKAAWNLDPRESRAIRAGQRTPLVAQHRCGIAIPPTRRSLIPAWCAPKQLPSNPQF